MSIVITPTTSLVAAQGVSASVVLQPGTVVAAQVLQILGNSTVHGELSLSAYTGSSGSGQVSSNIIYEPF